MGIQIDLVIPPIIVGLLIILIFRMNAFMMESSVDNRLNNDVQMFADVTQRVIQEELKNVDHVINPVSPLLPDTTLIFVDLSGDTIHVYRSDRNLEIIRINSATMVPDTIDYPANLTSILFDLEPNSLLANPYFLNVKIETESLSRDHASMRDLDKTVKAFSENQIYLRNVHINSSP